MRGCVELKPLGDADQMLWRALAAHVCVLDARLHARTDTDARAYARTHTRTHTHTHTHNTHRGPHTEAPLRPAPPPTHTHTENEPHSLHASPRPSVFGLH